MTPTDLGAYWAQPISACSILTRSISDLVPRHTVGWVAIGSPNRYKFRNPLAIAHSHIRPNWPPDATSFVASRRRACCPSGPVSNGLCVIDDAASPTVKKNPDVSISRVQRISRWSMAYFAMERIRMADLRLSAVNDICLSGSGSLSTSSAMSRRNSFAVRSTSPSPRSASSTRRVSTNGSSHSVSTLARGSRPCSSSAANVADLGGSKLNTDVFGRESKTGELSSSLRTDCRRSSSSWPDGSSGFTCGGGVPLSEPIIRPRTLDLPRRDGFGPGRLLVPTRPPLAGDDSPTGRPARPSSLRQLRGIVAACAGEGRIQAVIAPQDSTSTSS
jgi:hypothetical protein